jgi:hypothetical protein
MIELLKEKVRLLNQLLDDPQPGLISWCLALGKTMDELNLLWKEGIK